MDARAAAAAGAALAATACGVRACRSSREPQRSRAGRDAVPVQGGGTQKLVRVAVGELDYQHNSPGYSSTAFGRTTRASGPTSQPYSLLRTRRTSGSPPCTPSSTQRSLLGQRGRSSGTARRVSKLSLASRVKCAPCAWRIQGRLQLSPICSVPLRSSQISAALHSLLLAHVWGSTARRSALRAFP